MNLSRSSNAHEAHLLVSALCAFFSYRIRSTSLRVDLAAATTVVELGGARIGVPGHVPGHLDRAAVFKEGGDAGRAPAVVADLCGDPGLLRPPLEHVPGV